MEFEVVTRVEGTLPEIRGRFTEALFRFVIPPGTKIKFLDFGGCNPGNELRMELKLLGVLPQSWHNLITEMHEDARSWSFTDEGLQVPFPIRNWKHRHLVEQIEPGICLIRDQIRFSTSPKWLAFLMLPVLRLPFVLRKAKYQEFFRNQAP